MGTGGARHRRPLTKEVTRKGLLTDQ